MIYNMIYMYNHVFLYQPHDSWIVSFPSTVKLNSQRFRQAAQ